MSKEDISISNHMNVQEQEQEVGWEDFNLHQGIMANLKKLKFKTPTEIQKKVLSQSANKVDLVVQARTGEGKTLCYGIPVVDYILKQYEEQPQTIRKGSPFALIIAPTRELGIQIKDHIESILIDNAEMKRAKEEQPISDKKAGKNIKNHFYHKIRVANVMGGFAKVKQLKILTKYSPEIIVATPGRLWEIIENEDAYINFRNLRFLIFDEADRLMEKYHFVELKKLIKHIYTSKEREDRTVEASKNKIIKKKILNLGKEKDDEAEDDDEEIEEEEEDNNNRMNVDENNEELEATQDSDAFNEDEFIRRILAEKGITNAKIEDVRPIDILDHMNEEVFDDSNLLMSKKKKRRLRTKQKLENEGSSKDNNQNDETQEDEELELNQKNVSKLNQMDDENQRKASDSKSDKLQVKTNILLRTFLCSATIEVKSKEKNNISKAKQKKDYDNNIRNFKNDKDKKNKDKAKDSDAANLETLIKNLKFFNKLIYIKLDPQVKMTEDNIPDLSSSSFLPAKLQLEAFKCESDNKDYYLYHLLFLNKDKSIIVFTNSISHTKKLYSIFSFFDFTIKCLHSKMQQKQRISKLDSFRKNAKQAHAEGSEKMTKGNVLFCTDVGARGLDIPEVDIVIHYHIPLTTENFVHRSGRTARALKGGKCLSLVSEKELNLYKKILRELKIYELTIKIMPIAQIDHYRGLFDSVKKIEKEAFKSKKNLRENEWIKKQADKCDLIPDDNLEEEMQTREDEAKKGRGNSNFLGKKRKKVELNHIESKKLQQKVISHDISRSSYLNPNSVKQLNILLQNEKMNKLNLTETLRSAYADLEGAKKSKHKRTRHVKRRMGK